MSVNRVQKSATPLVACEWARDARTNRVVGGKKRARHFQIRDFVKLYELKTSPVRQKPHQQRVWAGACKKYKSSAIFND